MDAFKKQFDMITDIMDGKTTQEDVKKNIEAISNEYGDYVFSNYSLKKKEKPWTQDDLKELYNLCITGVTAKEVFLHMAEISDYLKSKRKKKIVIGVAVGVVIVIAAVIAAIVLTSTK